MNKNLVSVNEEQDNNQKNENEIKKERKGPERN